MLVCPMATMNKKLREDDLQRHQLQELVSIRQLLHAQLRCSYSGSSQSGDMIQPLCEDEAQQLLATTARPYDADLERGLEELRFGCKRALRLDE